MYVNLFILVLLLLFAFVLGAVSVLLYQFIRRYRYLKRGLMAHILIDLL